VEQVVGFDGELHGVGAHVSGLDDADGGDRDSFGVAVTGDEDQLVIAVGGDAADDLLFGTDFEGLDTLGNSSHQGDLFGG